MPQRLKGKPVGVTRSLPRSELIAVQTGNTSKSEVQPPARWRPVITCLLLTLAVWVVFGQTLHHEFVNCDDDVYVTKNTLVPSGLTWKGVGWAFTNLEAGFWHPLTWLSLMTDAQLYGQWTGGFHLTNVLLHITNTLLLFLALRRLTGAHGRSAVVAALFAVHPLHVESVAWISERKGLLSTSFWMLTLLFYARYARGRARAEAPYRFFDYGWALLFFACGLMSKTMVVTLPVVMLLMDCWPLRRFEMSLRNFQFGTLRRLVWEKMPFFGLAFAAGLLTIHAEKGIGALGESAAYPIHVRTANAALSSARYLSQTVWPTDLAVYYPYPGSLSTGWVLGAVLLLALTSLAVLWQGRRHPYLTVGWFWYVITLAPVSGLIQVGDFARADRYTYVPLVGIFLMAAWGFLELCGSWRYRHTVLRAATVAVLTALLAVAYVQTAYWHNSLSLWMHTLACTSGNPFAHYSLGNTLTAQGKLNEAIRHHELALQLRPDFPEAHLNLGNALSRQGRLNEAIRHVERALQLKPEYAEGHNNLGNALAGQGKLNEAIRHYIRALQLKPNYADAHNNLGIAVAAQEQWPEAIRHYERALQLKPASAEAHNNLGIALAAQGKWPEAIQHYERALQLKPAFADAHNNLGNALTAKGKLKEAIQHYEQAIQFKPDLVEAHANLGNALAGLGKLNEAIQHFQQALNLAAAQANPVLAETIRTRLESYQSALPQAQTP